MFRSIKKLNYTLQGMDDKLDILEKKVDSILCNNQNSTGLNSDNQNEVSEINDWPIFNDDQLNTVESKLENDNIYKNLMVFHRILLKFYIYLLYISVDMDYFNNFFR